MHNLCPPSRRCVSQNLTSISTLRSVRLSASTAPIVPPFSHEDMGPSSITSAELTLAFSGLPDEDLAAAAAAASGNLSLPSHAPASGSFMGYVMGTGSSSGAHGGGFAVPAPQQPSGLPGIVGAESGPAKKRRRAGEGMPGTAVGPGMMSTSQGQVCIMRRLQGFGVAGYKW